MVTNTLKFLVIPPLSKHTATVIFVHGLGDTGHGWAPVAQMFNSKPKLSHVKWVLPHAPVQAVTANMGMRMPTWFDISTFQLDSEEDEDGMLKTRRLLNELVSAELDSGIDASRIVLGGFSQGGAMALLTGLTNERKLGGVAALSGWLPLRTKFKGMTTEQGKSVPIFWGHGTADPLVRFEYGKLSAEFLQNELGITTSKKDAATLPGLSFNSYEGMQHSSNPRELDDLQKWLELAIPEN